MYINLSVYIHVTFKLKSCHKFALKGPIKILCPGGDICAIIFLRYWSQELGRKSLGKKPRLWVVIAKSFKWRFLIQGIIAFIEVNNCLAVYVVF